MKRIHIAFFTLALLTAVSLPGAPSQAQSNFSKTKITSNKTLIDAGNNFDAYTGKNPRTSTARNDRRARAAKTYQERRTEALEERKNLRKNRSEQRQNKMKQRRSVSTAGRSNLND